MGLIAKVTARIQRDWRAHRLRVALADPARSPPILCASIGRVGSNMLHRAIVEGRARALAGSFEDADFVLIGAQAWDLDRAELRTGSITKTHDFPYALGDRAPRIVFSFGRPSDTVLSVLNKSALAGDHWRDDHLRNMHAAGTLDQVIDTDILRLEEQLEAWRAVRGVPLFAVHYDALWDARPALETFLGFPIRLPERRGRGSDSMDPAIVTEVRRNYARLDALVADLPRSWQSA